MSAPRPRPSVAFAPLLVTLLALLLAAGPVAPPVAASEGPAVDGRRSLQQLDRALAATSEVKLKPALASLLVRVNRARERHGRKPLRATVCLTTKVAQPWAKHMAATETMVHQDLGVVFEKCPGLTRVGENIAYGYPTAKAVMRGWMGSEGHRRNILDKRFRKIGLGLARSADGTPYWVQDFAR